MGKAKVDEWDRADVGARAAMLCGVLPDKGMDQERLKKLLEVADQQDQLALKVLHNAVISGISAYNSDRTTSRLNDWKAAEKTLEEKINALWARHFPPAPADNGNLPTIAEVLVYLNDSGWDIKQSTLYRHKKESKIQPEADGTYSQGKVDKYAKTFLKQKSTGKKVNEKNDELQRKKLEIEIENLELERERKKLAHEKEQGKFIPREQMELELAGRAGILEHGLKQWIQSRAAEWIRTADGDPKKVGEVINLMTRDVDEHLNNYASREYQVIFDPDSEDREEDHGE